MTEISALIRLQEHDAIIAPHGDRPIRDLSTSSQTDERVAHRRMQTEAIALSGMDLEEMHLFFARSAHEAISSWNAEQSWSGRLRNRLTIRFPGYAQVPGRVLLQAMRALGQDFGTVVAPASLYLLRADVVADLRDQLAALREAS